MKFSSIPFLDTGKFLKLDVPSVIDRAHDNIWKKTV